MSQTHMYSQIDQRTNTKMQAVPGRILVDTVTSIQRPICTYLPAQYETRYAYPLVVLFHPENCNEETAISYAPRISDRNMIAVSMRGPKVLTNNVNSSLTCSWDGQSVDDLEEDIVRTVEHTRRNFHIHSERIYFVGLGDGGRAAYRAAFRLSNRIAGLAVLNSPFPTAEAGKPLFRLHDARKLRMLIGHGTQNLSCPIAQAERAFRLAYAAGSNVKMAQYSTNKTITDEMLQDVNRWVIGNLNSENDELILSRSTISRSA
jgi:phospholipase/carboxylesterase